MGEPDGRDVLEGRPPRRPQTGWGTHCISAQRIVVAAGARVCMVVGLPIAHVPSDIPPCAGCGKCCHLFVELAAHDNVPEHLVVEHAGIRCMDQGGDGACAALDSATQLCTIYDRRPQVCRDFERGSTLCRRAVAGRRGSLAAA